MNHLTSRTGFLAIAAAIFGSTIAIRRIGLDPAAFSPARLLGWALSSSLFFTCTTTAQQMSASVSACGGVVLSRPDDEVGSEVQYRWLAYRAQVYCYQNDSWFFEAPIDLGFTQTPNARFPSLPAGAYNFRCETWIAGQYITFLSFPFRGALPDLEVGSMNCPSNHNFCVLNLPELGPPMLHAESYSVVSAPGMTETLRVFVDTEQSATLAWYRNGVALPGQTALTLEWAISAEDQGATFEMRATNGCGTSTTGPIVIRLAGIDQSQWCAIHDRQVSVIRRGRTSPDGSSCDSSLSALPQYSVKVGDAASSIRRIAGGIALQASAGGCRFTEQTRNRVVFSVFRRARLLVSGRSSSMTLGCMGNTETVLKGPGMQVVLPVGNPIAATEIVIEPGVYVLESRLSGGQLSCSNYWSPPVCTYTADQNLQFNLVPDAPAKRVPDDYPTVQSAVNAAPTDVASIVRVGEGTFTGPVTVDRPVTIIGAGPERTILDSSGQDGTVVRFLPGCTRESGLFGVAVRGGNGSPHPLSPAYRLAGGILIDRVSPVVVNCAISGNSAPYGGGTYVFWAPNPGAIFEDSSIMGNNAALYGGGADLYEASVSFNRCTFASNQAVERGGAVHASNGYGDRSLTPSVVLSGCQFSANSAQLGSAICNADIEPGIPLVIAGSSFLGNTANGGDAGSAAVYSEDGPTITMTDSNVCRNSPRNVQPGALTHESARNVICDLCPDLDGDGTIGGADLGLVLANWGPVGALPAADLNGDSRVDGADLALILSAWGPCSN